MPKYFFQWAEEIVARLAENDGLPADFEQVVQISSSEMETSRSTGRPARIGFANDGRVLFCVFEWVDSANTQIEPVTAYEID